jgi:hypothetical protein
MSINPLANRARADACGFGNALRRLSARDLPYNALSTARRQPGILMHVHPVLPWNLKLQQPQLPRSEPDGQPTESSQLAHADRAIHRKAAAAIIFMEKPCGIYAARLSRLGAGL